LDIGNKINQLRVEKQLSMRQLGEKIGISHAHISKLESGINSPSVDLLEKLADFFNEDITYFFSKDSEKFTREITIEYLRKNYILTIDGKSVTSEEFDEIIKYTKVYRLMKQMEI
jgi:transcriptional regulator with XRE-family HTH domain